MTETVNPGAKAKQAPAGMKIALLKAEQSLAEPSRPQPVPTG